MLHRILIIAITFTGIFSYGQKDLIKESNNDFKRLAYIDAQQMYLEVVNNGFESRELFSKLGDTYYFNNDYVNAHKWYEKLFNFNKELIEKEYFFRYAQSLKAVGEYDKASAIMKESVALKGSSDNSDRYLKEPNYLELIEMQSGRFEVVNCDINTKAQDFGTAYYKDKFTVVFASSRDTTSLVKRRHKWNERVFLNLYQADAADSTGALSNVKPLSGNLNTKFHESNAVYTKDGNTVYFTRNNYYKGKYKKSTDDINKLKIFRARRSSEKEEWQNMEELNINGDEFSTAHPALNAAEDKLYFASDRDGSMIGPDGERLSDIWVVDIDESGNLGTPMNLEGINTAGNELFPFVSENGNLYFSSTGLLGLGGLDVFVSTLDNAGIPETPVNVGKPLNGPYDDFAFIVDDRNKMGYFSSNRPEGKGLDDIYRFKETKPLQCKVFIEGVVTQEGTGMIIPNAVVTLIDSDNNIVKEITTGDDAAYKFLADCDHTYRIRGEKEGYTVAEDVVTTPGVSGTIQAPLEVEKGETIDDKLTNVKVGDDLNDILDLNPIYFDFDKSNIRYDAEIELQKVLAFMRAYPTSEIDIRSHTDSRAPDLYNMKLSDRRAKSTRGYLIEKGIAASRLTAAGYGEFQLTNECSNGVDCTEEQHQLNRRSEFIVMKK